MKLCIAQLKSFCGDVDGNIHAHNELVDRAISLHVDCIIFPEMSITGYAPSLAASLTTSAHDSRFNIFQEKSDAHGLIIGVGVPLRVKEGNCIGMIIFQPNEQRLVYTKKYLHPDEEPFFVAGDGMECLVANKAAIAICYEISIPQHSLDAAARGAKVYIASVAKSAQGVSNAMLTLSEIAATHSMTTLMSNAVGESEGFVSAGNSAIWNSDGLLVGQLDDKEEGLLIIDSENGSVTRVTS